MKVILTSDQVRIPTQVTIALNYKEVTVTGPRGSDSRDFKNTQLEFELKDEGHTLEVRCWLADRKTRAIVGTVCGHIKNMVNGVLAGYQATMCANYKYYPIQQEVDERQNEVRCKNFYGRKRVSTVKLQGKVAYVKAPDYQRDIFFLEGNNLEDVTRNAALLENALRDDKKKDPVHFIDGIYMKKLAFIDKKIVGRATP